MFNNDKVGLILDFGHGGSDPGSTWYNGNKEKDYTLKIGLLIYNILKPHLKNIKLIRNQDTSIALNDRPKIMNEYSNKFDQVEVYSFHTNAFNKISRGIEILLSIHNKSTDNDWCTYFMKEYDKKFSIPLRGIVKRESSNNPGKDYYCLHRKTNSKCKVKIIEFGFGDNSADGKIMNDKINEIALFTAQKIAERFGIEIDNKKDWEDILKEVSPDYNKIWIDFVKRYHSPSLNVKGLIEKLYWTTPKK